MYILQSLANTANAVWLTETLPMPTAQADRLVRDRMNRKGNTRRYRLVRA